MSAIQADKIGKFKRLAAINRAITMSLDSAEVLRTIVKNAAELVEAEVSLLLLSDSDGLLRVRAAIGVDDEKAACFSGPMEETVIEKLRSALDLDANYALITVPVFDSEALSGLLAVARPGDLNGEDRWLLSALADQAAIALRNARLHEKELEQRQRANTRLASVSRELSESLDLDKLLDITCRAARDLTAADGAFFVLREGEQLYCAQEDAIATFWKGQRLPITNCLSGWMTLEHCPAMLEDIHSHERVPIEACKDASVKSLLMVPVRRPDPLGAIGVHWAQPRLASEHEVKLVEVLAEIVAITLSNASLYEKVKAAQREAERRADALLRLEEASAGLLAVDRETPGYDHLIELICHVTGAPGGAFWALDDSQPGGPWLISEWSYGFEREFEGEFKQQPQHVFRRIELSSAHPAARAARSMSLVSIADLGNDSSWQVVGSYFNSLGICSMLAVPLRARGQLLGVVTLCWRELGASCEEAVTRTAEVIAAQVAAAIDTAALVKELSKANRLKDEFIATLSHELRNPLNAILGFAEIISRSSEIEQSTLFKQAVDVIRRNARAQAQLVSDLLDLSRLQTGKLVINRQLVSLSQVVADAIESVRADAATKDIALDVDVTSEQLAAEIDPVRVQQIICNLLNNAVKFTHNGGKITIRLSRDGEEAKIVVEDTGQGIDPEFLPYAFDMFRQADGGLKNMKGGLGIGLAIVRQLAESLGGRVEAVSDGVGRGARFTVWLPLHTTGTAAAAQVAKWMPGDVANLRVLVIDDSEDTAYMMRALLEQQGAVVQIAMSAAEALRIAESKSFDLILSDISIPGIDGYELLRELRARPNTSKVPAIALTGFGQAQDVERRRSTGFAAHLIKPIDCAELIKTVREVTMKGPHKRN